MYCCKPSGTSGGKGLNFIKYIHCSLLVLLISFVRPIKDNGESSSSSGFEFLLHSLTSKHREVVSLLASLELSRREFLALKPAERAARDREDGLHDTQVWSASGVLLEDLLQTCKEKLIVQNMQVLQQCLRELKDHSIISVGSGSGVPANSSSMEKSEGMQYITVKLSTPVLENYLASKR